MSPLRLAHFCTIIFRCYFLSHIVNMACSSAISKEFSRKELLSLLCSVLDNLDDGKIKKLSEEQFKALFHFLNGRDTFGCLPTGHGKTLIYQIAVLIARTGKVPILPSNPLVVVVSPLNALISDQLESCQRLKLKAVKMEQELFALACLFTAKGLSLHIRLYRGGVSLSVGSLAHCLSFVELFFRYLSMGNALSRSRINVLFTTESTFRLQHLQIRRDDREKSGDSPRRNVKFSLSPAVVVVLKKLP